MRPTSTASLVALIAILAATPVQAVTVADIVELTRAGMSDEVIVALIEADGTIFNLNATDLVALKEAGVSQGVLLAMLRSGRPSTAAPAAPAPPAVPPPALAPPVTTPTVPPVIVVAPGAPAVSVPTPVYVPVPVFGWRSQIVIPGRSVRTFTAPPTLNRSGFGRFMNDGWYEPRPVQPTAPSAPVYWGWGGKLRPDAWGQPVPKPASPPD